MVRVGIIGGGVSGLTCAKWCIQHGLNVSLLEAGDSVGGLWSGVVKGMWPGMRTNLSKYSCCYSDFVWDDKAPIFPCKEQVCDYLREYAKHFELEKHIRLNSKVEHLTFTNEGKWRVKYSGIEEDFDRVIIASGFSSKSHNINFSGQNNFSGKIIHSKQFEGGEDFIDQNVVVVGGAFSGCEIASEIVSAKMKVKSSGKVAHIFKKPFWIINRYLPHPRDKEKKVPLDLLLYRRKTESSLKFTVEEENINTYHFLTGLCKEQNQIPELSMENVSKTTPAFISITEDYLDLVKQGQISLHKTTISRLGSKSDFNSNSNSSSGNDILLDSGAILTDVDSIIDCSGFTCRCDYLDVDLSEAMGFDSSGKLAAFLAFEAVLPRPSSLYDWTSLGFVGMHKGPFFPVVELQARWLALLFSGKVNAPSDDELVERIKQQEKALLEKDQGQYLSKLIPYLNTMAKKCNVKERDESAPVIPAQFADEEKNDKPSKLLKEAAKIIS